MTPAARTVAVQFLAALSMSCVAGPALAQSQRTLPAATPGAWPVQKAAPGLFVIGGAGGNTVVRVTSKGLIIVDTKIKAPGNLESLQAAIHKISQAPVRYVFLTHYHYDHIGNAHAFQQAGAQIVGQSQVGRLIRENPETAGADALEPTVTFDKAYRLTLGGAPVEAVHFARGHTAGDAVIYFPDLKAVVMGDLTVNVITPNIDYEGGGSLLEWRRFLGQVAELDFTICIPGHRGQVMTRQEFLDQITKWDTFIARGRALVKAGVPKDQLLARLKTDDLSWDITVAPWTRPKRVDALYAELSQ